MLLFVKVRLRRPWKVSRSFQMISVYTGDWVPLPLFFAPLLGTCRERPSDWSRSLETSLRPPHASLSRTPWPFAPLIPGCRFAGGKSRHWHYRTNRARPRGPFRRPSRSFCRNFRSWPATRRRSTRTWAR